MLTWPTPSQERLFETLAEGNDDFPTFSYRAMMRRWRLIIMHANPDLVRIRIKKAGLVDMDKVEGLPKGRTAALVTVDYLFDEWTVCLGLKAERP